MKKLFMVLLLLITAFLAKAGTFGLGDYVWKDDGSQAVLSKNAPFVKNDTKPVDLEMAMGMWRWYKTAGSGTVVIQYLEADANALPYVAGSGGTTKAQSPNYATGWKTITADINTGAWALAGSASKLTEGRYTATGLTYYSQIGTFTPNNPLNNIFDFGGQIITTSPDLTMDGTTSPHFVAGDYNYMTAAFKYALKPGKLIQPNTTYSFRLIATAGNWDGETQVAYQVTDQSINFNTYEGTNNQIVGGGANSIGDGNHFDHGIPTITTGPDLDGNAVVVKWAGGGLLASVQNGMVVLHWGTVTEVNNKNFVIERSADNGKTFNSIGTVDSKSTNGFSSNALSYQFTDAAPLAKAIYRVQQVDLNGENNYSNNVAVNLSTASQLSVYPNPATTYINIKGVAAGSAYNIFGITGNKAASGAVSSSNQVSVSELVAGVYILQVKGSNRSVQSIKFLKK